MDSRVIFFGTFRVLGAKIQFASQDVTAKTDSAGDSDCFFQIRLGSFCKLMTTGLRVNVVADLVSVDLAARCNLPDITPCLVVLPDDFQDCVRLLGCVHGTCQQPYQCLCKVQKSS